MQKQKMKEHRYSLLTAVAGCRMQQCEQKFKSRADFLKAVGVSEGSYYLILHGHGNPTMTTMERIAQGLGMTIYELIGNIDFDTLKKSLGKVSIDLKQLKDAVDEREAARLGFQNATLEIARSVHPELESNAALQAGGASEEAIHAGR